MENRESIMYRLVGTRGGIVLGEIGSRPSYLESFLQALQPSSTVQTVKVRNDRITYTFGPSNVYLAVYKEAEVEREIEEAVCEAKNKIEKSENSRSLSGIFKDKNENNEEEEAENNAEAEDSDPDEEPTGWSKWKNPESILKLFTKKKEVSEQSIQEHLLGRNIPHVLSRKIASDIVSVMKNEDKDGDDSEVDRLKKSFKRVISEIVPTISPDRIIEEIEAHKKTAKGPYVFCMVGVNGVGKSTTLSKLCLWILKNKYRICVAACDGFRSGAIEQLKKYVERYQARGHAISLYEKGYKKDEAAIASKAISHAVEHKYDVVLIDTCGRMPGNTQAMLSLSKLIRVNKPNKIFYVGEALVGNDSIDQIKGFNDYIERACVDKSIDGIIVTKCDAVDEKVGTIISLAKTVNKPVVFIGVGQKNVDLLPFDIDNLCEALYI
ncbi:signal recognition particle receptor subunit alpha [Nematocida minor]|uniref:signal recognition particle receptor subunit alpha n=1 Tax=Nematocida minor TaxID=1912983 RepID=UPI00221FB07F|nr:signal recognition particle receptor subunit alpha [Nematocida minor]KAI5190972.1 signal recognition particle receptor subunit alpha [Nematocida minor]